jgi:enoyl-CoA hydratase
MTDHAIATDAEQLAHIRMVRLDEGLIEVSLDRPPANALNLEMIRELSVAAQTLSDSDARVVLLKSAGPFFMAGADLVHMVNDGWDELRDTIQGFQAVTNQWEAIPAATVAVINGHAAGAGCELALACGWRLMAKGRPRIGLPEVRRGLLPAGGGTQRMARIVGPAKALDLCTRGLMIDADRAELLGLISEAVEPEALDQRSLELARDLLGVPRRSFQAIKRCVQQGADTDLASGLLLEENEMSALGETADAREGVRAFVEKREPVFVHN